jgi:hypothetical protein
MIVSPQEFDLATLLFKAGGGMAKLWNVSILRRV